MKYLPIFQELFESDTLILIVIGIVIAVIVGLRLKTQRKCIMAVVASVVTYVICEAASNMHTNFMVELILLFIGTVAIGCCIGFIICLFNNLAETKSKQP